MKPAATIIIRPAVVDDARTMMELHERSVIGLCGDDYTRDQLSGWVSRSGLEKFQYRIENHRSFVAEQNQRMIGFVRWHPKTRELCSLFVDPNHVRRGVASKLMETAIKDAITNHVEQLWLDASKTAVPFYLARGWFQGEASTNGHLECVRMTKHIADRPRK